MNWPCGNGKGFVKVELVNVPDSSRAGLNMNLNLKACEQELVLEKLFLHGIFELALRRATKKMDV